MGDLGKLIVAKGFKKLPKVQKIANLVTLVPTYLIFSVKFQASRIFLDASFTLRWKMVTYGSKELQIIFWVNITDWSIHKMGIEPLFSPSNGFPLK